MLALNNTQGILSASKEFVSTDSREVVHLLNGLDRHGVIRQLQPRGWRFRVKGTNFDAMLTLENDIVFLDVQVLWESGDFSDDSWADEGETERNIAESFFQDQVDAAIRGTAWDLLDIVPMPHGTSLTYVLMIDEYSYPTILRSITALLEKC